MYERLLDAEPKSRPEWPVNVGDSDFDGIIEACQKYLNKGSFISPGSRERKSLFHTRVSCQVQEVDWMLGNNKPAATCETSILVKTLDDDRPELPDGERGRIRMLLGLRVVLIAMLFAWA